jgi:predicted nuclease of predicted toxin-antitoxin system
LLKLYLNENISWRVARSLREYGYDVISSHEAKMDQSNDPEQFSYAIKQKRAVVTNNFRDFIVLDEIYNHQGKIHYGIIFTTKYTLSTLIKRLKKLLQTVSEEEMINQIRWLNEFE